MEESLSRLDSTLIERFLGIPRAVLLQDYAAVAGSDQTEGDSASTTDCDRQYRYLGTAAIFPWGSTTPWILPSSSVEATTSGQRVVLRIPHSRVRHYLGDAALYGKSDLLQGSIRMVRAVLRLGPDRILQSFDSEFACNIAQVYKRGFSLGNLASYNSTEQSATIRCPFYFADAPLRALPLFLPNTPMPEIEYEITGNLTGIHFLTEFASSPGEDLAPPPATSKVIQHAPTLVTFTSSPVDDINATSVSIPMHAPDDKIVRCLYFRAKDAEHSDIADAIATVDVHGKLPPRPNAAPLLGSLFGGIPLPGSLCRTHYKTRFGFSTTDQAFESPYYALPFTTAPRGQTADYGVTLPEGSSLNITLHPSESRSRLPVTVEVCVETFTRIVWQR